VIEMIRTGTTGLEAEERYLVRLATARPEEHLARTEAVGGRLLVPDDLEWPRQLDDLGDAAPWALWVRGTVDLRLTALRSVAVVGARAATRYGERVASQLGSDLAGSGWAVVSGGAFFGIDKAAHLAPVGRCSVARCGDWVPHRRSASPTCVTAVVPHPAQV
jgi:DNA processing protein